jgi:transposase
MTPRRSSKASKNAPTENIDFFDMPHWRSIPPIHTLEVKHTHGYMVEATVDTRLLECEKCGQSLFGLNRNGTRPRAFKHLPYMNRPLIIHIEAQAYICKDESCGAALLQPLPGIDARHKITLKLRQFILEAIASGATAGELERTTGVSSRVIREIHKEHIDESVVKGVRVAPEWLGIDDVHLDDDHVLCVLTDIKNRVVYDLLPSTDRARLVKYLERMPARELVQVVTMDMSNEFRAAVREALPKVPIVADRFHVVRLANNSLDAVRIRLQRDLKDEERKTLKRDAFLFRYADTNLGLVQHDILKKWFKRLPELEQAYRLKERFRRIWFSYSPETAMEKSVRWGESIPPELRPEFRHIVTQLNRWGEEVFNFCRSDLITFDEEMKTFRHATNGYAEAANRKIRQIWKKGNGYSFKVLRARVLEQPKLPSIGWVADLRRNAKETALSTRTRQRRPFC